MVKDADAVALPEGVGDAEARASPPGTDRLARGALSDRNAAVMGCWLPPALAVPGVCAEPLAEMFKLTAAGALKPMVHAAYPLEDARRAFEDLVARRTTGKVTLRP